MQIGRIYTETESQTWRNSRRRRKEKGNREKRIKELGHEHRQGGWRTPDHSWFEMEATDEEETAEAETAKEETAKEESTKEETDKDRQGGSTR